MVTSTGTIELVIEDYDKLQAKGNIRKIFKELIHNELIYDYNIRDLQSYKNKKKDKILKFKSVIRVYLKDINQSELVVKLDEIVDKILNDNDHITECINISAKHPSTSNQYIKNGKLPFSIKYHVLPDDNLKKLIDSKPELLDKYERWEDILHYAVDNLVKTL